MGTILREDKRRELPTNWELTRIGNVVDIHGGSTPSTAKPEYWDDGGILWATPTDITSLNTKYISDTERKISQKAVDETSLRLCEPGTLLMTSRATIGCPAIAEKPITTNQGFINIHCGNKVETLFLYYWIAQNRALLERFAQGSTFLELPKKDFRRFHIDLPPLPEQRKIAEILSTVDEVIEKTDSIIQETQRLKKGLMQKLFTEGIGHTRFKETKIGRIPEEWEVITLASITERFLNGGTPNTNIDKYWNGDIPWVTGTDVIETVIYPSRRFITHEGLVNSSTNLVPKDSILIVTRTGVGKIALAGCDLAISQDLTGVILNKKFAHNIFFLWYLKRYSPKYISLAQGTTIGGILRNDVERTLVPIPSIEEQRRIAEVLSEVDSKTEREQAFKEELEQLKKGLMQVLLTGKVRVKV